MSAPSTRHWDPSACSSIPARRTEASWPVGETEDAEQQRWTFTYRPGNGYEYLAEVGWSGTLPGVVRLARIQIGPLASSEITPGSTVAIPGSDGVWIVVDVTGNDMAVLRRPDDPDLKRPEARWVRELRLAEDQ